MWAQEPIAVFVSMFKALCFGLVAAPAAALDFPQGAPVDWEDGPLPSTRAAWVLVDAKAAQLQLPWQLVETGVASVVLVLCVILLLLCWRHGLFFSNRGRLESQASQEVDLEVGLADWDTRSLPGQDQPTVITTGPPEDLAVTPPRATQRSHASLESQPSQEVNEGDLEAGPSDWGARCIQRAWRGRPLDRRGAKMLQDFARRAARPCYYNLSDFDEDDLLEGKLAEGATWRAIQTAPALFQQAPANAAACASSFEGFEACRLALARLAGDVGTAATSAEEMQEVRGHVLAAMKVVGGAIYEVHRLSNGTTCVELSGLGCYQCIGAGRRLVEHLEQRAREGGHAAVVLLAVPSAIRFYLRCDYRFLSDASTCVEQALFCLSSRALYRHAAMLKYV